MYNERKKQDIMRKRLERISILMGYLRDFAVEGLPAPILGVNNGVENGTATGGGLPGVEPYGKLGLLYGDVAERLFCAG